MIKDIVVNFSRILLPDITKTRLYNVYPLKPNFYIVKLGFTGVLIIFLVSAQKHGLWVLVRTASPRWFLRVLTNYVLSRNMKKYQSFFKMKISSFKKFSEKVKFSIYWHKRVFVMKQAECFIRSLDY